MKVELLEEIGAKNSKQEKLISDLTADLSVLENNITNIESNKAVISQNGKKLKVQVINPEKAELRTFSLKPQNEYEDDIYSFNYGFRIISSDVARF